MAEEEVRYYAVLLRPLKSQRNKCDVVSGRGGGYYRGGGYGGGYGGYNEGYQREGRRW